MIRNSDISNVSVVNLLETGPVVSAKALHEFLQSLRIVPCVYKYRMNLPFPELHACLIAL